MANLTIVVDDELLRKARIRAAERDTSVNAVLRDFMAEWAAGPDDRRQAVERLIERSKRSRSARGGRRWTRDELHERHPKKAK